MAYKRVTEEERTLIYRWGQESRSQSEIARRPGPRRFTATVRADARVADQGGLDAGALSAHDGFPVKIKVLTVAS